MKKTLTRILSLVLVVTLVAVVFCACQKEPAVQDDPQVTTANTEDSKEPDTSKTGLKFGFMTSNPTLQFFVDIADAFEANIREGDSCVIYSFDDDLEKQASIVSDLIAQKVDMIVLNCVDGDVVKGPLQAAEKAGIPVIVYESKTNNPELVKTMVLSDDYGCGYEAGKALAEAMGYKGKVASFCWERSELGLTRLQGLKDAIAEYPDMELVANYDDDTDLDTCLSVIENMLLVHPDITGFYSFTENSGLAAASVFAAAERDDIVIVTVDSSDSTLQCIADGTIYAGIDQQASLLGKNLIEQVYKYFDGEELEPIFYSPIAVITKDNLSDYGY